MGLPSLTAVQRDFSAGQITEKAARRDDIKIQRSGLRRSINTRALASGSLSQRFGRSAYNLDTGRTEIVRISDTLRFEFLFGDGAVRIRDNDGVLLNTYPGPWTLDTIDEIGIAIAERDVFLTYRNTRPLHLTLGSASTISSSLGTAFGDLLDSRDYPQVLGTATGASTAVLSTHTVPLPADVEPGDLLIAMLTLGAPVGGGPNVVWPAGWTMLAEFSSAHTSSMAYRVATGSEGASIAVDCNTRYASYESYRIGEFTGLPEAAFAASQTLDPPSLTPSWGSAKTLWLAVTAMLRSDQTVTAAPTNYTDLLQVANPSGSSGGLSRIATAQRELTATSDNPGAFTVSGSGDNPHAATIAVRPFTDAFEVAKAFDGITNKPASLSISKLAATEALIGLNLTAAPQQVAGVRVYGSNDQGFVNGSSANVTLTLYGKNGSVPTLASPGTSLGTNGPTADTANESAGRAIASSDAVTAWDYLAVKVAQAGAAATMYVGQIVFSVPGATLSEDNWLLGPFVFETTPEGALRQPYIRFADAGVTMLPSARSGTGITLTFSGPALDSPGHVGVSFRYHGREVVITGVTSATVGTANVIEKLPPTMRVVSASANGRDSFKIGQVVIGETSGAEGLIVAFNSTTGLDIIVYQGDTFIATERIVSPTGQTIVTGAPTEITVAASPVWDEAAMSDFRGWPDGIEWDRSRLILCDFPQSPRAIAWSAIGAPRDFYVGAEPADAFLEFAPGTGRVLHVLGGNDQYVLTDLDVMYIPISEANPLAPGSVAFRPIAAIGASSVQPVAMHEGIVYATANNKSLVAIVPTGQTSFPYRTATISEFHADLFTGVKTMAAMAGGGTQAEQYLWVCQDDGTALAGKFDSSNEWVGFVLVNGAGLVKWISALGGDVRFNVQYQADASPLDWAMESLDEDQFVDCGVPLNQSLPALRPDPEDLTKGRLWFLAGLDVDLMDGSMHLGTRTVDSLGFIVEETDDDFSGEDVVAGFGWTLEVQPYIANSGEGEERGQRARRRRVKRAIATVINSTIFTLMGRPFGSTTPRSGTYRAPGQKRTFDPTVPIVKAIPGPFTLLELTTEVTT